MCFFGLFVKTQVTIEAWAYIWIRSATQLINVSVFMQALCYSYCNSFCSIARTRNVVPLAVFLLLMILLAVLCLLCFHMYFKFIFNFCEELLWNFDEDYIEAVHCFW